MFYRFEKPLEGHTGTSKGTRTGAQSAQGARAQHSYKILVVLRSGRMYIISGNVTDKILQQPVPIHVKKLQASWRLLGHWQVFFSFIHFLFLSFFLFVVVLVF